VTPLDLVFLATRILIRYAGYPTGDPDMPSEKTARIVIKCRPETKDLWDKLARFTGYDRNREKLILELRKNYLRAKGLTAESV